MTIWPRIDWRTWRISPAPPQPVQVVAEVPGLAPVASQVVQGTGTRTRISFDVPNTAEPEVDVDGDLHVGAPRRPGLTPAPRLAEATAAPAEEAVEQVAQAGAEEVFEAAGPAGSAPAGAPKPFGAEHVIAPPALGVAEGLIGQRDQLEPLLGGRVAAVDVGVQLTGQLAVGPLDLILGGAAADAEQHVEVLELGGHVPSFAQVTPETGADDRHRRHGLGVVHAGRPQDADGAGVDPSTS